MSTSSVTATPAYFAERAATLHFFDSMEEGMTILRCVPTIDWIAPPLDLLLSLVSLLAAPILFVGGLIYSLFTWDSEIGRNRRSLSSFWAKNLAAASIIYFAHALIGLLPRILGQGLHLHLHEKFHIAISLKGQAEALDQELTPAFFSISPAIGDEFLQREGSTNSIRLEIFEMEQELESEISEDEKQLVEYQLKMKKELLQEKTIT